MAQLELFHTGGIGACRKGGADAQPDDGLPDLSQADALRRFHAQPYAK